MAETSSATDAPTLDDVRAAARRIAGVAHRTPVATCSTLDARSGAALHFKCEHLQKTGAFKFRGACNAIRSLEPGQAARGVATHSSGNHGGALALAARMSGIRATIVVPHGANPVKRAAIVGYGAQIVECGQGDEARQAALAEVVERAGCTVVHPYDDLRVMAGQGTAALELLEEVPEIEVLVAPVGGGGLLSGTVIAAGASPGVEVWGAEPAAADDTSRSLRAGARLPVGEARTIADGLRTSVGALTFPVIRDAVTGVAVVQEDAIVRAMRLAWERAKLLIEPSAAVALAAILEGAVPCRGRRVGVILSGGNVDLDALPWCTGR
jgi:threonine dehydratase